MKLAWCVVGTVIMCGAGACLLPGCGKGEKAGAKAPALRTAAAPRGDIPLPEWAPENPSPEFMRAARVLKPLPEEMLKRPGAPPGIAAALQRSRDTIAASYEFFGTLDDRQIERFRATKEIRIPSRSLTPRQRAVLDHWFENWRTVMKGTGLKAEDYRVFIYKMGGKEDMSNVDVGFRATSGGHMVHIHFWVRTSDGEVNDFGTAFAQI
jgi:hypothetical protein